MEGIAGETAIKLMHKKIGICISYKGYRPQKLGILPF
jgi:hypothetical protein